MKRRFTKILMMVLALTVVVGACIGLSACNDKEVITVGYTIYSPMNYEENGELVGFDTDLAKKVFTDLGYEVVFKEIDWKSKYVDLNAGTIDCIWNGFTANSSDDGTPRSEIVDFSYYYMKNYQAIVVKKSELANYTDKATSFSGKTGYIEAESAAVDYAATLTGANVKEAAKQMDAIMQVKANAADFAVVDYLLANSIVGTGDYADLAFVPALNSDVEYYGIGFKKGSELTAKVNAQLEKYAQDGTLAQIAATYDLTNAVITDYADQK